MRILIISDIHANQVALETVLNSFPDVDAIWSLGDIVGYGPRPSECIEIIRKIEPEISVIGNHDWASIGRLDLKDFNPVARFASYWTTTKLNADQLNYLESLPNRMIHEDWTVVHGSPQHPVWEYVYNARIAETNFGFFDTRLCFMGHTHVQLFISEDDARGNVPPSQPRHGEVVDVTKNRYMINPGSVGQPRDGDPRAACAIFDPDAGTVTFYRFPYSVEETQRQMQEEGLPESLVMRLAMGV